MYRLSRVRTLSRHIRSPGARKGLNTKAGRYHQGVHRNLRSIRGGPASRCPHRYDRHLARGGGSADLSPSGEKKGTLEPRGRDQSVKREATYPTLLRSASSGGTDTRMLTVRYQSVSTVRVRHPTLDDEADSRLIVYCWRSLQRRTKEVGALIPELHTY